MGSDDKHNEQARVGGNEGTAGHSGEGSDSVLRLIRLRRMAQSRETAADPDSPQPSTGEPDSQGDGRT